MAAYARSGAAARASAGRRASAAAAGRRAAAANAHVAKHYTVDNKHSEIETQNPLASNGVVVQGWSPHADLENAQPLDSARAVGVIIDDPANEPKRCRGSRIALVARVVASCAWASTPTRKTWIAPCIRVAIAACWPSGLSLL